ncbi:unnamed protein product [Rotaria sp. Silwood2]|nr:unnamed protein product [Rotaria sp. Silwood2]CAF3026176.1 unnamed protein product [Rotaria sp. Silwood2]CAF3330118.1 unnamed protein product [Rotaria sp. Silwood2]CAF4004995.1 unnamed protein product [Rotaria sp. Silwood2]CAF4349528.1 unnamed protein product [Rotaria sp. Silwood2]
MVLGTIDGAVQSLKIIVRVMENLSIPLGRARRVVLGTRMEELEQVPERIWAGNTFLGPWTTWEKNEKIDFVRDWSESWKS